MSESERKDFEDICYLHVSRYAERLGLTHYHWSVVAPAEARLFNADTYFAQIVRAHEYDRAVIMVRPVGAFTGFYGMIPDHFNLATAIAHEIAHVFIQPLTDVFDALYKLAPEDHQAVLLTAKLWDAAEERVIERIAELTVNGIVGGSVKSYKSENVVPTWKSDR